jgi:hypothetical protein
MKKSLVLFASIAVLFLVSCGKYEDGPGFSLRSKTNRLQGNWEMEKFIIDGQNDPYLLLTTSNFYMTFNKDGSCKSTFTQYGSDETNGTWEFSDNKNNLKIDFGNGDVWDYKITRLTNDELWMELIGSQSTVEYHYKSLNKKNELEGKITYEVILDSQSDLSIDEINYINGFGQENRILNFSGGVWKYSVDYDGMADQYDNFSCRFNVSINGDPSTQFSGIMRIYKDGNVVNEISVTSLSGDLSKDLSFSW